MFLPVALTFAETIASAAPGVVPLIATAAPALPAVAAGAGTAAAAIPGIGALLSKLATDPVWGPLLAEMGTGLVGKFLGFGGQSEFEQANQQRLQAAQGVLPDLKRAAAGLPTASSDALMRQVRREGTAIQQSMAASARGSGLLGGTPQGGSIFRAQSERIGAAQTEVLGQRLGQHQNFAQQLLLGQLQPAIQQGNLFATQDLEDEVAVKTALGRLGRKFAENPNDDVINRFIAVLEKLGIGGDGSGGTGGSVNTPTPGLPAPASPQRIPFAQQFKSPITQLGVGR